jgi:hypothetical protein
MPTGYPVAVADTRRLPVPADRRRGALALAPLGRPKVNERVIFSGRDTKERTAFGSVPSAKAGRYEVAR